MKSAQISSEIFIYILAILIIGTIVLFGYKKAVELSQKGEDISVLQFKKQIESLIQSSMGSGNVFEEELVLPKRFNKICFVDLEVQNKPTTNPKEDYLSNIVYDSWKDRIQKNVFLVQGSNMESFHIEKLRVDKIADCNNENCLCIPASNGKAKLKFIGKGKNTFIERVTMP